MHVDFAEVYVRTPAGGWPLIGNATEATTWFQRTPTAWMEDLKARDAE